MIVDRIKPLARDVAGYGLKAIGLTRPDQRLYYAVTFHRVLPQHALSRYPLADLAVTPEAFRWFLGLFGAHFTCGTVADTFGRYKAGERPDKPLMAITFDDGQLDNYEYARPELERAGLKASFFVPIEAIERNEVLWHDRLGFAAAALQDRNAARAASEFAALGVPDGLSSLAAINAAVERAKALAPDDRAAWVHRIEALVGDDTRPAWDGMMTWPQLRTLVQEGHEVGSHSMSHQILTQLDRPALDFEIGESRRILETQLNTAVTSFCYPNGNYNGPTLGAVAAAGYTQAVTTRWGPNRDPHQPLTLTRCDIQTQNARSARGSLSRTRMLWRLSRYFPDPAAAHS